MFVFKNDLVTTVSSEMLPLLFLQTTPHMLKKRSMNALEAGIVNNCIASLKKFGRALLCLNQNSFVVSKSSVPSCKIPKKFSFSFSKILFSEGRVDIFILISSSLQYKKSKRSSLSFFVVDFCLASLATFLSFVFFSLKSVTFLCRELIDLSCCSSAKDFENQQLSFEVLRRAQQLNKYSNLARIQICA